MFFSIKKYFFALHILFFTAFICFARDIIVYIEDADLAIPLEGAVIHTWDNHEFVCNDEGIAVFSVPDTRPVLLQITYPGYKTERITIPASAAEGSAVKSRFTIFMRIDSMLENKELVFVAEKTNEGTEVKSGRSVSIAGKDLARISEIGFLEDVMTAIKLLPGVGYTGMFDAMPSIRGGDPGDLVAVLDGFYIENPYFWGGGVSIFDPHMIESARLSHGIFSSRYGHTISGLLELTSKTPSPTETEIELGLSSSVVNLNVSIPFRKGGIMVMGKATYWDGYIALLKWIPGMEAITVAPYIRAAAFSGNYRFTSAVEMTFNGFIGGDGVGLSYKDSFEIDKQKQDIDMNYKWDSLQGFLISGLTFNPRNSMVLRGTAGGGFSKTFLNGDMSGNLYLFNKADFISYMLGLGVSPMFLPDNYIINGRTLMKIDNTTYTAQTRIDYDWEIGGGFLFAAGVQEFYNRWTRYILLRGPQDILAKNFPNTPPGIGLPLDSFYVNVDIPYMPPIEGYNQALISSAYTLLEYKSPQQKFGAELGLRVDHLYFIGKDFTIQTYPAVNPRLNMDFNILKNKGFFNSWDITAGAGFFSSLTDNISSLQSSDGIDDFELKQNRSLTSLFGTNIRFLDNWSFNVEFYYKYIFDRAYSLNKTRAENGQNDPIDYYFNGEGRVWGFDFMLQKYQSRYLDGWISYTFTWARYKNPLMIDRNGNLLEGDWRWPSFHHFHNLNLVMNIKPAKRYNIAVRFSFASGAPLSVAGEITSYPVLIVRPDAPPSFIQEYKRSSSYSDTRRDGFALPLDIKFSRFSFNKNGKAQGELYLAAENALSFLKTRDKNTTFNQYTGTEVKGSDRENYQMPIPMVSFGIVWSY
ncbi:MAG: TonB-dependent receptor plug domain-containing protein [Spirochaetaceae bacterium]|jgi:hypothetical protein|nr:TonB-dependent receptor plug domain-containing protein [Spirochaetaceae bacterium]